MPRQASDMSGFPVQPGAIEPESGAYSQFMRLRLLFDVPGATFTDSSQSQRSVAPFGNVEIRNPGEAVFDGAGDYLEMGASQDFDIGNGPFCIAFRFMLNTTTGDQTIISCGSDNVTSGFLLAFGVTYFGASLAGKLRAFMYDTAGNQYACDSIAALAANTWYEVKYFRKTDFQLYLKLDGVQQATANPSTTSARVSNPMRIGKYDLSTTRYFNGRLGPLRYWKGSDAGG